MHLVLPPIVHDALADRRLDLLLWGTGVLVAALLAPLTGDELRIVTGIELALLALVRLALKQEMRWFWSLVIATGVAMPFMALGSVPLFYGGGLTWESGMATGGLACGPGLSTVAAGVLGLRLPYEPVEDPGWLRAIDTLMHLAIAVAALTFMVGVYAPGPVILAGGLLTVGLVVVLKQRMRWTRRGVGLALAWVGNTVAATAALLWVTSTGHVSQGEALVAIAPAGLIGLVGMGLTLRA